MIDLTFDQTMRNSIETNLNQFERREISQGERRGASVAIVVTNCSQAPRIAQLKFAPTDFEQAGFILTTRSHRLNTHRGQRAFPGGGIDDGETAEQAALRELKEEINLELGREAVLGCLDDYATRSGFVITPVVVWAGNDLRLEANPDEVEAIHVIPFRELLREDAPILEDIPESEHPVLKMPLGEEWFAAPTAAIAYQFSEVALLGKATRVAHFEQPYFAWR